MSTIDRPRLAPLVAGERMSQSEFHERYEAMPEGSWFELIGGSVVKLGRVDVLHAETNAAVVAWLGLYSMRTPGLRGGTKGSTILGEHSEVHPDAMILVQPECGGQTYPFGGYIGGAPELVVEAATASLEVDLGPKLADYERAGVLEYIVIDPVSSAVYWHARIDGRFTHLDSHLDGIYRSVTMGGLWLDATALFEGDGMRLIDTLDRGIATPQHARFTARLGAARSLELSRSSNRKTVDPFDLHP